MEWNIADLFEKVVDLAPDREALICGDARRTYASLEERSNRLAHHLALGNALAEAGDRGQAIARFQEALKILEEIEAPDADHARTALARLRSDD